MQSELNSKYSTKDKKILKAGFIVYNMQGLKVQNSPTADLRGKIKTSRY